MDALINGDSVKKEDYEEKYGEIPQDPMGRLDYILGQIKSGNSVKGKLLTNIKKIQAIPWKRIEFVIYLVPKGTPRPRASKWNHFYVKGAADNKKLFKKFYKAHMEHIPIIKTACKFDCESYLPIPKAMKMYEQIIAELGFIRPISKPDFDNLAKTYSDMLQGILLHDDALIIDGRSRKFYSVKPRIKITISYMTDYDCEFNRKKLEKQTVTVGKDLK